MSKRFKIFLILSLVINCVFIVLLKKEKETRLVKFVIADAFKIKDLNVKDEKEKFFRKLQSLDPHFMQKKYFFINIWISDYNGSTWQLPILDTLVEPLRKDMSYVFVNEESDNIVHGTLMIKKVHTKNFIYLNNADSLMHAFYQEMKMKDKFKFLTMLPMSIIIDRTGKIIYRDSTNCSVDINEDTLARNKYFNQLRKSINNLK